MKLAAAAVSKDNQNDSGSGETIRARRNTRARRAADQRISRARAAAPKRFQTRRARYAPPAGCVSRPAEAPGPAAPFLPMLVAIAAEAAVQIPHGLRIHGGMLMLINDGVSQ
jgi:hypothetical protein